MAATVAAVPSAIVLKVLNTNNYEDWSFRVKTYLLAEGLWKVVAEDGEAEFEDWSKKNAKALHAIHISCGENIFPYIRGIDTAKAAWNTLEKKLKPVGLLLKRDAANQSPIDGELELQDLKHYENSAGRRRNNAGSSNDTDRGDAIHHFFDCVEYNWRGSNISEALEFLKRYPQRYPIRELRHPSSHLPALHFAFKEGNLTIVDELVRLMTAEDLEETLDASGRTAISYAFDTLLYMWKLYNAWLKRTRNYLALLILPPI